MFSEEILLPVEAQWRKILDRVPFAHAVDVRIRTVADEDVREALRILYAVSPISDWGNYDFHLFLHAAQHGVFLKKTSDLPEKIFVQYVLPIRVNEEALSDCRKFFHSLIAPRIQNMNQEQATIAINYWCAENMTYRSTDERTISALDAYNSAFGRCGEESTLLVNALRACGIAARQIYTPRWAHCDDNHAWVEVWLNGEWHFLGACEPEEVLDNGWFTNAAARTILIHSRNFVPESAKEAPEENFIARIGDVDYLNQTARYAQTVRLNVQVVDEGDRPVQDAEVTFGILNMSEIFPATRVRTDANGCAHLDSGKGHLFVSAHKGDSFAEKLADARKTDCIKLILNANTIHSEWRECIVEAPDGVSRYSEHLTEEQCARCAEKNAAANRLRGERVSRMFDRERAEKLLPACDGETLELLKSSRGNFETLLAFLAKGEKFAFPLLKTLSEKDLRDVHADVLEDALAVSDCIPDENAFYCRYVLCPRVANEPLQPVRRLIRELFSEEEKKKMVADPRTIQSLIQKNWTHADDLEYDALVTAPLAALRMGMANPHAQDILFVAICRALGVPARLNPVDNQIEYWQGANFVSPRARTAKIVLLQPDDAKPVYYESFTIARFENGKFITLDCTGIPFENGRMALSVVPGKYRILTVNRLPGGNIHASAKEFVVADGESAEIALHFFKASREEILGDHAFSDFRLSGGEMLSTCTDCGAILMRIEPGAEPTEHLLGELLAQAESFDAFHLVFFLNGRGRENELLKRTLERFPSAPVFTGGTENDWALLARQLRVDSKKLPLAFVTDRPLHAVYAASGYNVGLASMLCKMVNEVKK